MGVMAIDPVQHRSQDIGAPGATGAAGACGRRSARICCWPMARVGDWEKHGACPWEGVLLCGQAEPERRLVLAGQVASASGPGGRAGLVLPTPAGRVPTVADLGHRQWPILAKIIDQVGANDTRSYLP